jgi:hypothetical protein
MLLTVGIKIDSNNKSLWAALKSCQDAYEADKKQRFSLAATERAMEEERIKRQDEIKKEIMKEKTAKEKKEAEESLLSSFFDNLQDESNDNNIIEKKENEKAKEEVKNIQKISEGNEKNGNIIDAKNAAEVEDADTEDNLLADFFTEVSEVKTKKHQQNNGTDTELLATTTTIELENTETKNESLLTEKYVNQDLGDSKSQFERILCKHYEWKNLNPYRVLQLGIDATDEDIKYRYRKLSLKVHPDRMRGVENARVAFEQVYFYYFFKKYYYYHYYYYYY